MNRKSPPSWLESTLRLLLADRDRESVGGDLQEEYAERAARRGTFSATVWYVRQLPSFGVPRFTPAERTLAALAAFALLYGTWFGVMELILRHPGYLSREWIPAAILAQAMVTLLFLVARGSSRLRLTVLLGCLPILWLVSLAVRGLVRGADLEGYVLLMALSLVVQSALTVLVILRRWRDDSMPEAPA